MMKVLSLTLLAMLSSVLMLPVHAEASESAETRVGIFDSGQLGGGRSPLADPLAAALAATGAQAVMLDPQQAADPEQVHRRRLDVLIYMGPDHTISVGRRCIDYLGQGGRLWYIGDGAPFTGVLYTAAEESGQHRPAGPARSEEQRLHRGRSANPNAAAVSTSEQLTRSIHRGSMYAWRPIEAERIVDAPAATDDGRRCFPRSIDAYCRAVAQDDMWVLSLRSGDYPWIRPSCRVVGMSRSKYGMPSWAGGRPNTSAGYPLGMIADACGAFGGARTLFAGHTALERLADSPDAWSAFVAEAVRTLVQDDLTAVVTPRRAVLHADEAIELDLRVDNYRPEDRRVEIDVRAVGRGSGDDGKIVTGWSLDLPPRGQIRRQGSLPAGSLPEGLYDLVVRVHDKEVGRRVLSILPGAASPLTRQTFFTPSAAGRFVILFRSYDDNANNIEVARETGLQGFSLHIPWVPDGDTVETAINWPVLDRWIGETGAAGMKVIIDAWDHRPYPQYFIHFKQGEPRRHWEKYPSMVVTENHRRWEDLWRAVAERYVAHDHVVGMFLAPGAQSSFQIDLSEHAAADYVDFLRTVQDRDLAELAGNHGMALDSWEDVRPPDVDQPAGNMFARILDYHAFWVHQHLQFLHASARAVRAASPDMALLLRGPYDYGPNVRHAAELMKTYGPVSIHAENVETTVNTHTPMYGSHLRYGVPISAENGWPANRGEPTRHAFYKALMGHYTAFLYSGGSSIQLLPNLDVLAEYAYLDSRLRDTRPVVPRVAALIHETTELFPAVSMPLDAKWNTPRFHRALFRRGYPAMATNIERPDLRDVDIAIDGGGNAVVRRSVLQSLVRWTAEGHTLVISDKMAAFTEEGPGLPLAERLRAPRETVYGVGPERIQAPEPFLAPDKGPVVERIAVGDGQVLVLNQLGHEQMDDTIDAALEKLGAARPVACDPPMPLVVREDDRSLYVILYDVDPDTIGGYFNYDDAAEDLAIDDVLLNLTLTTPFAPAAAVDLARNKVLDVSGREVQVALRKGHGMVVRIDRPGGESRQ